MVVQRGYNIYPEPGPAIILITIQLRELVEP